MQPDPILPYARPADPSAPMTARAAATIGCRLIAVWLFGQSAQGTVVAIVYLVTSLLSVRGYQVVLVSLAVALAPLAAGCLLWSAAGWIARRVVPDDAVIGPVGGHDLRSLITAGLVMVGASTVAWAVHDLTGAAVLASQTHVSFALWWHDVNWLRAFAANCVVLGVSAWLIFGGRGLIDLVHRARTAGQPTPVADHL